MILNFIQQMRIFVFIRQIFRPHICIVKKSNHSDVIPSLMQKKFYLLALVLLFLGRVHGQGWEHIYGGSGQDVANAIARTPDGGYIVTGYYNGNLRLYLFKVDADGTLQWSTSITGPNGGSRLEGTGVVVTPDNGYAIVGYLDLDGTGTQQKRDIYLLKTDAYGNKLWDKTFSGSGNFDDEGWAIAMTPDGGFVITGFQSYLGGLENIVILRTDNLGNKLWSNTFGSPEYHKRGSSIQLMSNGDIVVAGEIQETVSSDKNAYVLRVGTGGNFIREQTYGTVDDDDASAIVATPDGNFLLGGSSNSLTGGAGYLLKIDPLFNAVPIWEKFVNESSFNGLAIESSGKFFATGLHTIGGLEELTVLKFDPSGNVLWEANATHGGFASGNAIIPSRGGAVIAGASEQTIGPTADSYAYLVRVDGDGKILTSYVEANIFRDFNNNCQKDIDETGLKNWIVRFDGPHDTLFTVANSDGLIRIAVDTGIYNAILYPPNPYWQSCSSSVPIHIPAFYDTVEVNIPARTVFDCPRNEVDIATPILHRCSDNVYQVRYCNSGTVPSLNTQVSVVLDPDMTYVSSSANLDHQSGDTLFFNAGTVMNGDCKDFTVTAFLSCNGTVAGQTHCVSAYITPDSFCNINSGWDGAIIAARAYCNHDSVKMVLSNIGASNMTTTLDYVITEDIVMLTQPGDPNFRFQLNAGQDSTVWTHAATGHTYRIIAQQSPGYPGISYPTAAVEGCQSDTSTSDISLGFYTMFPEDDQDAFKETDCQESSDTDYNPSLLKRGHPKGYDDAHHYVDSKTDLDYLIQFKNTGADTVRQVIVRDTLSAALDPASVYPGAASHPYEFNIYGSGIVQFTLKDVNLLPGGGAGSEGFVKFRVAQKPELPCGTIIFNSAAIYYDFNAPSFSNTVYHTSCPFDSFIVITKTREIFVPGAQVNVFPNPAYQSVTFEVDGVDANIWTLELYDIQGRMIFNQFYQYPTIQLLRRQLPAGELFYRLSADGTPVASGKLIVK